MAHESPGLGGQLAVRRVQPQARAGHAVHGLLGLQEAPAQLRTGPALGEGAGVLGPGLGEQGRLGEPCLLARQATGRPPPAPGAAGPGGVDLQQLLAGRSTSRQRAKYAASVEARALRGLVRNTVTDSRSTHTVATTTATSSPGTMSGVACRNEAKKNPIQPMNP